jgi:hypothetical protein
VDAPAGSLLDDVDAALDAGDAALDVGAADAGAPDAAALLDGVAAGADPALLAFAPAPPDATRSKSARFLRSSTS